jgi:hypothetical protein
MLHAVGGTEVKDLILRQQRPAHDCPRALGSEALSSISTRLSNGPLAMPQLRRKSSYHRCSDKTHIQEVGIHDTVVQPAVDLHYPVFRVIVAVGENYVAINDGRPGYMGKPPPERAVKVLKHTKT